jgi:hypothetical protein
VCPPTATADHLIEDEVWRAAIDEHGRHTHLLPLRDDV